MAAKAIQNEIELGNVKISNNLPFVLIAGPCQLESRDHAMEMAEALSYIASELKIGLVFKTSFDKANRTSLGAQRGMGLEAALPIFAEIKENFNIPIVTDVHHPDQCAAVAEVVDILQIPAFLCRQTDLLIAAAKTGRVVKVKKGQFLAPWDMQNVVNKIAESGNNKVMLTERGVSFGYNNLVTDIRSLDIMKETGCPIIFDATHSVQQPGGMGGSSGGQRRFVSVLAKAAITTGIAGIFMETHQDPDNAPSDGPCMLHLKDMPKLISELMEFDYLAKKHIHK
jgi:2-dehydro-3-deoxyphosphooctonate aldolase (KDO 8-P synthase)